METKQIAYGVADPTVFSMIKRDQCLQMLIIFANTHSFSIGPTGILQFTDGANILNTDVEDTNVTVLPDVTSAKACFNRRGNRRVQLDVVVIVMDKSFPGV